MTKKRTLPGPATAPFTGDDLCAYAWDVDRIVWRDNVPFYATLELGGIERGRSAAHFLWNDTDTGANYQMFMADAVDLMRSPAGVQAGKVTGWWIVVKRGANYGVARLMPALVPDDVMAAHHE